MIKKREEKKRKKNADLRVGIQLLSSLRSPYSDITGHYIIIFLKLYSNT